MTIRKNIAFILSFMLIIVIYSVNNNWNNKISHKSYYVGRNILSQSQFNCSPRAIDNFPKDLFTNEQRKSGALILHFICVFYMFIGLAIVCEDYFVPSLESICENLRLQPDVAGATFMAAGSSAPELATTMIGVFVARDDIGLGAVVGSADYNLMLVIGLSALYAKTNIHLNWWPLIRDCFCYSISIILLAIVIFDEKVYWYEAFVMLICYGLYIILNYWNPEMEVWAKQFVSKYLTICNLDNTITIINSATQISYEATSDEVILITDDKSVLEGNGDIQDLQAIHDGDDKDGVVNRDHNRDDDVDQMESNDGGFRNDSNIKFSRNRHSKAEQCFHSCFQNLCMPSFIDKDKEIESNNSTNPLDITASERCCICIKQTYFILCWPLRLLLCCTVPDCQQTQYRKWFWVTFTMSCVWIAAYSYVMIWVITIIGVTLNIPDTVMGLTFIAAGSSVPDAIASVLVVKEGQGDMAVSNAVGSNVFDILICMGFPWFLKSLISSAPIFVYSKGLLYAVFTLFLTVFMLIFITHMYKWRMSRSYGIILIVIYFLFLVLCSLYELNIFGKFHLPECPLVN